MRSHVLVISLVVALSGCGFGLGRVLVTGTGHHYSSSGGGGGSSPVDDCVTYDDHGIRQAHDYTVDTHPDDDYASTSESSREVFTADLPFGMDLGAEMGWGSADVGDASSSGYTAHYHLELVVPRPSYGVALQGGYTTQHLHDIAADEAYSGFDAVAKLLVPFGEMTAYAGLGWVWGELSSSFDDGGGIRALGGLMIDLPLSSFSLMPRVELQYTNASGIDYSAFGGVGSLNLMF